MGDITELGNIVAGAFAHLYEAGNGEYLVGDLMSFNKIVDTLNRQGHKFSCKQLPKEVFANFFPETAEAAEMFSYCQVHTYSGSDSHDKIALANKNSRRSTEQIVDMGQDNSPKEVSMIYSTATVPMNPAGEPPLTAEQTTLKRISSTPRALSLPAHRVCRGITLQQLLRERRPQL